MNQIFAIFAIIILNTSLISISAIPAFAQDATEYDYTDPTSYNDADFWANVDYNQVQWNQVTSDIWEQHGEEIDQSQIPPDYISEIPADLVDVTVVQDKESLTAEQLAYEDNLEDVGDLGQLNPSAISDALNEMHSLEGTIITVIPGVTYNNGKLVNEAACEAADVKEKKCRLELDLEEFKSTEENKFVISAVEEYIAGEEAPGFIICRDSCNTVSGQVEEVTVNEDGSIQVSISGTDEPIEIQAGDVGVIVGEDGDILFMSENGVIKTKDVTITAHGVDGSTTVSFDDKGITVNGIAEITADNFRAVLGRVDSYLELEIDNDNIIYSGAGNYVDLEMQGNKFSGAFDFYMKDGKLSYVDLLHMDGSNPSYFQLEGKKKIVTNGEDLVIHLSDEFNDDALDLTSYLHIREGFSIWEGRIGEECDEDSCSDEVIKKLLSVGITCDNRDECLDLYQDRYDTLAERMEGFESGQVFMTRDGEEYAAYGKLAVISYDTVDGVSVDNILQHRDTNTMSYFNSNDNGFILDNTEDTAEDFARVNMGIVVIKPDGSTEKVDITTKFDKEKGLVKSKISASDALKLAEYTDDYDNQFKGSVDIMPVSNDGRESHIIVDNMFAHALLAVSEELPEGTAYVEVNVGDNPVKDRVAQYQRQAEYKADIASALRSTGAAGDATATAIETGEVQYEELYETLVDEETGGINKELLSDIDEGTEEYEAYEALYAGMLVSESNEEARTQYKVYYDYVTGEGVTKLGEDVAQSLQDMVVRNIVTTYSREGEYETALNILTGNDGTYKINSLTGDDYYQMGQVMQEWDCDNCVAQAKEAYQQMQKYSGYEVQALMALGDLYNSEGDYDTALSNYMNAYQSADDNYKAALLDKMVNSVIAYQGEEQHLTGDTNSLDAEFDSLLVQLQEQGVPLDSDQIDELRNRYISSRLTQYAVTLDIDEAKAVLENALTYNSDNLDALSTMISITEEDEKQDYLDEYERQVNDLARESKFTIDVDAQRAVLEVYNLQDAYVLAAGSTDPDFTDAEYYASQALMFDSENENAHYYLANIYKATERTDEAKDEYEFLLEKNPDNIQYKYEYADILARDGDYTEAKAYFEEVYGYYGEMYTDSEEQLEKIKEVLAAAEAGELDPDEMDDETIVGGCSQCTVGQILSDTTRLTERLDGIKEVAETQIKTTTQLVMGTFLVDGKRTSDAKWALEQVEEINADLSAELTEEYQPTINEVVAHNQKVRFSSLLQKAQEGDQDAIKELKENHLDKTIDMADGSEITVTDFLRRVVGEAVVEYDYSDTEDTRNTLMKLGSSYSNVKRTEDDWIPFNDDYESATNAEEALAEYEAYLKKLADSGNLEELEFQRKALLEQRAILVRSEESSDPYFRDAREQAYDEMLDLLTSYESQAYKLELGEAGLSDTSITILSGLRDIEVDQEVFTSMHHAELDYNNWYMSHLTNPSGFEYDETQGQVSYNSGGYYYSYEDSSGTHTVPLKDKVKDGTVKVYDTVLPDGSRLVYDGDDFVVQRDQRVSEGFTEAFFGTDILDILYSRIF